MPDIHALPTPQRLWQTVLDKHPSLKHLLVNSRRDYLSTMAARRDIEAMTWEDLCREGYLLFDESGLAWDKTKDCFLLVAREEQESFFGEEDTRYVFQIFCDPAVNDLDDCKTRMLEICALLTEGLNGMALGDGKKLYYMLCQTRLLSDRCSLTALTFTTSSIYRFNEGTNPFARYAEDNRALFAQLFTREELKTILGAAGKTFREAYTEGRLRLTENLAENPGEAWQPRIILTWEFDLDASILLIPVAEDKKQLQELVSVIKNDLPSFRLPGRGRVEYVERLSKEELALSERLTAAMLLLQ